MTVSKTYTVGQVTIRYEAETISQLVELVAAFADKPAEKPKAVDDWIDWTGGDSPAEYEKSVDYRLRGGEVFRRCKAGTLNWIHDGGKYDIIAYRLAND